MWQPRALSGHRRIGRSPEHVHIVAQDGTLPLLGSPHSVHVPGHTPLLSIWPPANVSWEELDHGCSTWTSATHMGDLNGVRGCWFQPSPTRAIMTLRNQWMEEKCVSLSVCVCLPFTLYFKRSKDKYTYIETKK